MSKKDLIEHLRQRLSSDPCLALRALNPATTSTSSSYILK
jgi:hypothetical protein